MRIKICLEYFVVVVVLFTAYSNVLFSPRILFAESALSE